MPFDAVEIRPARLPVIRVTRRAHDLVRLELDEFERTGPDRMAAHLGWRDVARIDRRPPGCEQRKQRWLRPLQMKGDLVIAAGGHPLYIRVPGLARIDAELFTAGAHQQVPSAFDIGAG